MPEPELRVEQPEEDNQPEEEDHNGLGDFAQDDNDRTMDHLLEGYEVEHDRTIMPAQADQNEEEEGTLDNLE